MERRVVAGWRPEQEATLRLSHPKQHKGWVRGPKPFSSRGFDPLRRIPKTRSARSLHELLGRPIGGRSTTHPCRVRFLEKPGPTELGCVGWRFSGHSQ